MKTTMEQKCYVGDDENLENLTKTVIETRSLPSVETNVAGGELQLDSSKRDSGTGTVEGEAIFGNSNIPSNPVIDGIELMDSQTGGKSKEFSTIDVKLSERAPHDQLGEISLK